MDEISDPTTPLERPLCPRIDHDRQFWYNTETGERRPDSCRAIKCDICGLTQAWKKAQILSHGGASGSPTRFAVLTRFPDPREDWQKGRQKIRDLRRLLLANGVPEVEWAWTVEVNADGEQFHANLLLKGSYIPQELLQRIWGSIVHIQAIKTPEGAHKASQYVLKEAQRVSGYVLKEASEADSFAQFRLNNGGRLAHFSAGYLGGWTQEQTWQAIQADRPKGTAWRLVTR